ncbi:hypothetical protein EJB05_30260, partial [Eragrostis curvula]
RDPKSGAYVQICQGRDIAAAAAAASGELAPVLPQRLAPAAEEDLRSQSNRILGAPSSSDSHAGGRQPWWWSSSRGAAGKEGRRRRDPTGLVTRSVNGPAEARHGMRPPASLRAFSSFPSSIRSGGAWVLYAFSAFFFVSKFAAAMPGRVRSSAAAARSAVESALWFLLRESRRVAEGLSRRLRGRQTRRGGQRDSGGEAAGRREEQSR